MSVSIASARSINWATGTMPTNARNALGMFDRANIELDGVDSALIDQCRQQDAAAFESIVNRYKNKVYNFVYRMISNPEDAEDITQEVFLRVYTRIHRFRGDSSFQTWLFRIATNLCVDRGRKLKRQVQQATSLNQPLADHGEEGSGAGRDIPDLLSDPYRAVARDELQQVVQDGLGRMSEKLRAVVVLYDIQGLSYEEISQTLGVPMGTVKSRLFNARAELARRIKGYVVPG